MLICIDLGLTYCLIFIVSLFFHVLEIRSAKFCDLYLGPVICSLIKQETFFLFWLNFLCKIWRINSCFELLSRVEYTSLGSSSVTNSTTVVHCFVRIFIRDLHEFVVHLSFPHEQIFAVTGRRDYVFCIRATVVL